MKYFVYAYNYLTLHKGIVYARNQWGLKNTYFLFSTNISDAPVGINSLQHFIINSSDYRQTRKKVFSTVNYLIANKKIVKKASNYINLNVTDKNEAIRLVVFRDIMVREALLMDIIKKKYKNAKVIMMEEGLGAYTPNREEPITIQTILKGLLFIAFRIPLIALRKHQLGYNPKTDEIICSHPEMLKKLNPLKQNCIIQEIDVFSKGNSQFFISKILGKSISQKEYDYVFLTQPLFPQKDVHINQKYNTFLENVFKILSKHGKLLIKLHPHDAWDYDKYESDNVDVCSSELAKCPFECIYGYYGNPQSVTLYSTAAFNTSKRMQTIFLYDFFPEIIKKNLFSDEFIRNNNIIRCNSYAQFDTLLYKIKEHSTDMGDSDE